MVAATLERETVTVVTERTFEYRDQHCPVCHGHLGVTRSAPGLPHGMVWHRIRCHARRCQGKERLIDLAGGVVRANVREGVLD